MGKKENPSFGDKLKLGLSKAKTNLENATKSGLTVAKQGLDVVAHESEKVAKASGTAIKHSAEKVAEKAAEAKHFTDEQIRAGLDKAYARKRPVYVENLARLKKSNPKAKPSEILEILEKELHDAESKAGSDSTAYIEAAALYALTAVEVYGEQIRDPEDKQQLVDWVILLDSGATKGIVEFGGLAVTLVAGRIGAVGKAVAAVGKVTSKLSWLNPLIAMAGIKNPGKKSASWVVINATKKLLGESPESWKAPKPKTTDAS